MDSKQKFAFAAIGVVCGLLIVTLAVLLFLQIGAMGSAKEERDSAERELDNYYGTKPYPSDANREIRREDDARYTAWSDAARAMLTQGLEIPEGESPSQFVTRIGESVRALNDRQNSARVGAVDRLLKANVPASEGVMDYSFGRYVVQGEMPRIADVPRLAAQFAVVERVCDLLLDNGAVGITQVTRLPFDTVEAKPIEEVRTSRRRRASESAPSAAPGAVVLNPALEKDGVICESYSICFRARYATLAKVLNALAQDNLFVVVTDLSIVDPVRLRDRVAEMIKKRQSVRENAARRAGRSGDGRVSVATEGKPLFESASPTERLVSDPEHAVPLEVVLKFDVYSAPALPAKASSVESIPVTDKEGN